MDKQVIIAISREYGSGGHEIAKIIADDMGLNLYDRSLLDEIAREKDIKIEYLEKYDEKTKKNISFQKSRCIYQFYRRNNYRNAV